MPTHWESSERPLFVRTVVVNGSRHAILSHVDPLSQARKSDSSPEFLEPNRKVINSRRIRSCYPFKRDVTSELQNCLVKLRVVLGTQEQGRKHKKEVADAKEEEGTRENWKRVRKKIAKSQKSGKTGLTKKDVKEDITGFRKGNSYSTAIPKTECEDIQQDEDDLDIELNPLESETEKPLKEIAKTSERTNLMKRVLPLTEATEELLRNYSSYFFPIVYIKADGLVWEDVDGEKTVPKNVNNPLSERVLQWLDLARKRKESLNIEKPNSVPQNQPTVQGNPTDADDKIQNKKSKPVRCKSDGSASKSMCQSRDEDVEDEVKHESDIETVLSSASAREYPKFSRESNKLHKMKNDSPDKHADVALPDEDYWEKILSIPEKTSEFSLTEQLQQSILESFEAIVNLERKAAIERTQKIHSSRKKSPKENRSSRKKSLLMKSTVIRISSDEEETPEYAKQRTRSTGRKIGYFNSKKSWKYHCQRIGSANEDLEPSDESERQVRIIYNETPLSIAEKNNGGRRIWATEKGANKPHLHIFMPGINPKFLEAHDESASDIESIVK